MYWIYNYKYITNNTVHYIILNIMYLQLIYKSEKNRNKQQEEFQPP